MTADLVIGIDQSTTATKAIAFDRRGQTIAAARAAVALSNPRMGWFEQQASDWTGTVAKTLRQVVRKVGARRVAAVAISNQRESFAQFGLNGEALRPATVWLDERAHVEVAEIANIVGHAQLHEISGIPSDITPCISRCLWLAKHEPKMWAKTVKTAEVHGVIAHFLTGEWITSTASASPMGLLDVRNYDWSDALLDVARLRRDQLPSLARPGDVMGYVTAEASALTGLKTGTPVVAGGGDGQCAGLGTNTFVEGRAFLNLGTAVVSGRYGQAFHANPAFRSLVAVGEDGYSFETAIRTGTYLISWFVERLFGQNIAKSPHVLAELERDAARVPIGARGLVLLPYFSGIMTPYWDTAGRGVLAGLSGSHTRGDIYRALLEGIALEQAMMTNAVAAASGPIDHYAAVGGGSKSDLWCQIFADATGRKVKRFETAEASALGAAMAAAKGAGWYSSLAVAAAKMSGKPTKTFSPKAKAARAYAELLDIYTDLWPQISAWNGRLQALNRRPLS
jgi:sugar (pentulose or hexulose) kinase